MRLRVLARKNPVGRISASTSSTGASANESASGKRANSAGVVRFTRSSVHWADRMVAASSWNGIGVVECAQLVGRSREERAEAAVRSRAPDRPEFGVGPWAEDTGRFSSDGGARASEVMSAGDVPAVDEVHLMVARHGAASGSPA